MTATNPALSDRHATLGARAMPLLGATVAAHYGDPEAEYRAATTACALLDLSAFTKIRVTGNDGRDYLNRRLSQKLDDLEALEVRRATLLGAEGRMQADLECIAFPDSMLLLSTPASDGTGLAALLDRFVFSEDVQFLNATGELALFALLGPKFATVLEQVNMPQDGATDVRRGTIGNAEAFAWPSSILGGEWFILVEGDGNAAWNELLKSAQSQGGCACGFMPFDSIRIESGTPWWGIDLDARTIPLDAHLTNALSYTKGCYPGQETIAKITNLGHPARQLVGVVFKGDDPPAPGTPLLAADGEAGRITSSAWSPALNCPVALAMVRWPYRNPGTAASCAGIPGEIRALPLTGGGA